MRVKQIHSFRRQLAPLLTHILLILDRNMWVGASAPTLSDLALHFQSVGAEETVSKLAH